MDGYLLFSLLVRFLLLRLFVRFAFVSSQKECFFYNSSVAMVSSGVMRRDKEWEREREGVCECVWGGGGVGGRRERERVSEPGGGGWVCVWGRGTERDRDRKRLIPLVKSSIIFDHKTTSYAMSVNLYSESRGEARECLAPLHTVL